MKPTSSAMPNPPPPCAIRMPEREEDTVTPTGDGPLEGTDSTPSTLVERPEENPSPEPHYSVTITTNSERRTVPEGGRRVVMGVRTGDPPQRPTSLPIPDGTRRHLPTDPPGRMPRARSRSPTAPGNERAHVRRNQAFQHLLNGRENRDMSGFVAGAVYMLLSRSPQGDFLNPRELQRSVNLAINLWTAPPQ